MTNQLLPLPELVALDVETTGLYPQTGDRIAEVALLHIYEGRIKQRFVTLVNPEREISLAAFLVNGISNQMVREAPTFREIAGRVRSFLEGRVLLVHNAGFDLAFLKTQLKECGVGFPETQVIDTLEIARRFFSFPSNALVNLAGTLQVSQNHAHRAESDAWTAYQVFCRLWEDLKRSLTLEDVLFPSSRIDPVLEPEEVLPPLLLESLGKDRRVTIRYMNREGGISVREIQPREVIQAGNEFYLVAFCYLKNEERKFRLDRILEVMENIE